MIRSFAWTGICEKQSLPVTANVDQPDCATASPGGRTQGGSGGSCLQGSPAFPAIKSIAALFPDLLRLLERILNPRLHVSLGEAWQDSRSAVARKHHGVCE